MLTQQQCEPKFNTYDSEGFRRTITGSRSHKTTDTQIIYNLRFKYGEEIANLSNEELINHYDEFSVSEDFGDNDAKFLDWIRN